MPLAGYNAPHASNFTAQTGGPPPWLHITGAATLNVPSLALEAHVDDLLANRRLGHVGSDGSRVAGRLQRVGYAAAQVSENWVYSRDLARGFRWWMADPPHRANILHRNFTEIGVGMAPHPNGWGQVWVVDFAAGANGPAAESLLIGEPPTEATIAAAEPAPIDGNIYVIQAGDTLDALGRRLGITTVSPIRHCSRWARSWRFRGARLRRPWSRPKRLPRPSRPRHPHRRRPRLQHLPPSRLQHPRLVRLHRHRHRPHRQPNPPRTPYAPVSHWLRSHLVMG